MSADARPFAKLYRAIWRDPEFVALDEGPQRLFLLLLSHPDITIAGTIPLTYTKWSRLAHDSTPERVRDAAAVLDERCFVIVDEDEQEAFVRSVMRLDILTRRSWQLQRGALRLCRKSSSARIKLVMADEIERSLGLFVIGHGVGDEAKQTITELRQAAPEVDIEADVEADIEQNTEHRAKRTERRTQNAEHQSTEHRTQNADTNRRVGRGVARGEGDLAADKQRALQSLREQYPDDFADEP